MDKDYPDLGGRRLEHHVRVDRILDVESGHEFGAEHATETSESFDGVVETVEYMTRRVLPCGHLHQIGQPLARCDACSANAGKPMFVCQSCSINCPVTGASLCVRCTCLGPDGRRYSPAGLKQAKKMGLFNSPSASRAPAGARRKGWLARLLEWW